MLRRGLPLFVALLAGCGAGPAAAECLTLDLRAQRGEIAATVRAVAEHEVRVVLVHEGHVAWRATRGGPFTHTQRMKDYQGPDRVSVRTTAAGGKVCTASAVAP